MNLVEQAGLAGLASRLRQLSDRLMSESGRIYREAGVAFEPRWFPVFFYLSRSGPSSVTDIARGLMITHPRVHQIGVELIDANLAAAYKDSRDRRRRVLALTSFGKSQLPRLEEVWQQIDEVFSGFVDPALPALLAPLGQELDSVRPGSR